jgi:hypothetical protein
MWTVAGYVLVAIAGLVTLGNLSVIAHVVIARPARGSSFVPLIGGSFGFAGCALVPSLGWDVGLIAVALDPFTWALVTWPLQALRRR